jgi:RND family efflux transporter MFP subunit
MKWNKWTVGLAVLVVVGGYYWYRSSQSTTTPLQYITASVDKGLITASVSGSGNVIVDQSATVDPTITGTVAGLSVALGDSVKKGQPLFTVVNDQLDVNVAQAGASNFQTQNSIDSALLNRKQASSDYSVAKKKNKTTPNTYTKKQLSILKQKIDIADQSVSLAEKNVAASNLSYRKTTSDANKRQVLAPIDGTVNEINIKNGDDLAKLSSGSSKLSPIILGDLTTLKASVSVNEVDISNVAVGQKATATFSALDGLNATGKVEKIDSLGTVSQGVVTYRVQISFDSIDPRIKPNMSVSASIINNVKQNVLMVPNSALKSDNQGSYVETLANNVPQRHSVETGLANNTNTEIVSGLNAGDEVITQTIDPNIASTTNSAAGGLRIPGLTGGGSSGGGRPASTTGR